MRPLFHAIIGVEYATILSALDTKITLIDRRSAIRDFVDADIVDSFRHDLARPSAPAGGLLR